MGLFSRSKDNASTRATPGVTPALEPAMSAEEQSQLCAILATRRPRTVIEWGSGGSTLLLPATFDFIETYVSVEHNAAWHERVVQHSSDDRVTHLLVPPVGSAPEPEMFEGGKGKTSPAYVAWSDRGEREPEIMADYVAAPFEHVPHPDLVLIDGRARRFCIERAWAALRSGGVMVVHDAQREQYIEVIDAQCGRAAHWFVPWSRGQICVAAKDQG